MQLTQGAPVSATVSFCTLRKAAQESAFPNVKSRLTHFDPVPF